MELQEQESVWAYSQDCPETLLICINHEDVAQDTKHTHINDQDISHIPDIITNHQDINGGSNNA